MHKLVTLSDKQFKRVSAIMTDRDIHSFSQLVAYLVLFYEDNAKRPLGRPKTTRTEEEADANDPDNVEIYAVPDKFTTGAYSYNDLVGWYETHPEAGKMPARKDLLLYKGKKSV